MLHRTKTPRPAPQGLLLSIIEDSKREAQIIPPVFGVQASWLCFGTDLAKCLYDAYERRDFALDALKICDISYLYRLWRTSNTSSCALRLVCPALGIDQPGDLLPLLSLLRENARADATRRMGKEYCQGDRLRQDSGDSVQTTAWQGENRTFIFNSCTA